jgi:hypothetical protein
VDLRRRRFFAAVSAQTTAGVMMPTFRTTITVAFFLVLFLSACVMPVQSDTWWHLRAGQEMWTRHFVMLADEFSFTATGSYWPNHEWLSEVLFYAAYRVAGLPGMTLVAASCVTGAVALSWRLMQGTSMTKLLFMAGAIPSLVPVWTVRPHVFTLVLMMLIVHLLLETIYWPIPLLFAVWANLHGGVAIGIVVLGAVTLADGWMAGRERLILLVALSSVCFAATFATPLGLDLWKTIPESVNKSMANGIAEWRPPVLFGWRDLAFWITALLLVGAAAIRRRAITTRQDAVLVGISLALLPLALRYSRNVTPFTLVAIPALNRIFVSPRRDSPVPAGPERYAVNAALLACIAVAGTIAVAATWAAPVPRLQWRPVSDEIVKAIRACPGRLYNRFDDGGYVIWFAQGVPVFVDNRQDPYPLWFLQDHLHQETSGDFESVFARYQLQCAFLPPQSPTAQRLLSSGWNVTARDASWLVLTSAPR